MRPIFATKVVLPVPPAMEQMAIAVFGVVDGLLLPSLHTGRAGLRTGALGIVTGALDGDAVRTRGAGSAWGAIGLAGAVDNCGSFFAASGASAAAAVELSVTSASGRPAILDGREKLR